MAPSIKTKRLSIRVAPILESRLRKRSAATGKSESVLVREAIEAHLAGSAGPETALELAKRLGLVGKAKNLPPDLSTNPAHLEDFGRRK